MIDFIKGLFGKPEVNHKPEVEMEREWIYMGDGMMEEVITQKEKHTVNDITDAGRITSRRQNSSSTSSHTQTAQPYVYTDISPSYDSGSSCDSSGSFGGSCD